MKNGRRRFLSIGFLLFICTIIHASDTIYIVQEAWHTGIVLKTRDVSREIWPEIKNYQEKKYIDVSWGDERYYQKPGINILLAARAVFFPTTAVIRLLGFDSAIEHFYFDYRSIRVIMDSTQFNALCHSIAYSLRRNDQHNVIPSMVYGKSEKFFIAKRKYHVFRTCNTWVLLLLKHAGLSVNPFMAITSGQLFRRLKKSDNTVGYL